MRRPRLPFERHGGAPFTATGALLLLAAAALGSLQPAPAFAAAWLTAWCFCGGLVVGGAVSLWLHALTGGRWGVALRAPAARLVVRRGWLVPLCLPLAFHLPSLYAWAAPGSTALHELDQPAFAQAWLSVPAFAVRCTVYALAAYWLAGSALQPAIRPRRAAASLIAYGLLGSLAVVDVLMSLTPGWRSTGFALLVLMGQALGGAAAMVGWLAWRTPARLHERAADGVPVARDLGNLLLMYAMVWGYLGFMQFLVIWSENLPHEIRWFLPRVRGAWFGFGVVLVALQLGLPMAALVLRCVKDNARGLGAVAAAMLLAHALDMVWLVVPSVAPDAVASAWLVPLCGAGMALLVFAPALAAAPAGPVARAPIDTEAVHAGG